MAKWPLVVAAAWGQSPKAKERTAYRDCPRGKQKGEMGALFAAQGIVGQLGTIRSHPPINGPIKQIAMHFTFSKQKRGGRLSFRHLA